MEISFCYFQLYFIRCNKKTSTIYVREKKMNIYLKFGSTLYLSIFPNIIDTKINSFHAKRKKKNVPIYFDEDAAKTARNINEILKKTKTGWTSDVLFIFRFPPFFLLSIRLLFTLNQMISKRKAC